MTKLVNVSICIPTYNMASFVGLAIESALNQTFSDFELVICDNASTDNTQEVLKRFADPRVKVFRNPENVGACGNFNLAIERASGEWVKFLEADDMLEPTCLERCVAMIQHDPEIDVVSVGRRRVYSDGTPFLEEVHHHTEIVTGAAVRRRVHLRQNEFGTPSEVMARKTVLQQAGGFDPAYGTYLNDWDLWLRCQEHARKIAFVAEPLALVRRHEGQIGVTGARANSDIDVVQQMLRKRWSEATRIRWLWWQYHYMLWLHSAPYFLRGVRQAVRGRMAPGVSRWDTFSRLIKHLGIWRFVWTAGTAFCFVLIRKSLMRMEHRIVRLDSR